MATNTTNYALVKPAQDDFYDIDVQNGNMDIIDAQLKNSADHIANKSNPHGVTKSQVGLGNVPNVATNDQTPTYTAASANTALSSGEKLSVAFGKIAKAISSLISHLANTSNPHSVTKSQLGLGNVENKSSATIRGEITSSNVTTALGYTPPTTNTTYNQATSGALGLVKIGFTESGKDYPVELNSNGQMYVNVPWTDNNTVYTHPSYTARTGVPTADAAPAFGGSFNVSQPVSDASGHITAVNSRKITIPSTAATQSAAGLMSAADKTKLDGIATGANQYSLPTGNASTIGGLKLSDSTSSTSSTSGGVAATPKAVKTAYDLANAAMPKTGGTFTGDVATTEYYMVVLDDTHYASIGKDTDNNFVIAINNNGTWVNLVKASADGTVTAGNLMPKSGGTFTGAVTLSGAPTADLHAATKAYADTKMPTAGGTFTGTVLAKNANYTGHCLRNIDVRDSTGVTSQSTNLIRFDRKS